MPKSKRGFTIIELLVVITIIGLLATVVLAGLTSARQKGRDARRMGDLKQMSNAIALIGTGQIGTSFAGCSPNTTTGAAINTCTIGSLNFLNYLDPSGSGACTKTNSTACNYTLFATSTAALSSQAYEICDFLETGASVSAAQTMTSISHNSTFTSSCP